MDSRNDLRQLKDGLRWYHPLTPWVYLALSVCGGLLALNAWEQVIVGQSSLTEITTIGLVIAFAVKLIWWKRAGNQQSESTQKLPRVSVLVRSTDVPAH